MTMRNLIKTDRILKDFTRWNMAHALGSDSPDCYEYFRNIIIVLRGYENIREAMDEELGEEKDTILKVVLEEYPIYLKMILELKGMIRVANEKQNNKLCQLIEMRIKLYLTKIDLLHTSILKLFIASIKRTDLALQYVPSDQILASTKQQLSYKTPLRRSEDMGINE